MRIVHVLSSLEVGGLEQFVVRIANAQRRTADVSIVAIRGGSLLQTCGDLNTVVLSGRSRIVRLGRAAAAAFRLKPHIVHAHNFTSLHYAAIVRSVGGGKLVLTDHSQGSVPFRLPTRHEWKSTSAVVAVSHVTAGANRWYPPNMPVHVIHNGVERFTSNTTRANVLRGLGISPQAIVAIMVGRIDGMKGHDVLLQALALYRDAGHMPFVTLIVGDGRARAELEGAATRVGLSSDWVRFLGFRSDIGDLLSASDIFTLPSLSEGLPLSVLEAMAAGLPVVATAVGGYRN